ncbi:alginate export family protein [Sandaracinus amylolyticus]|uniref:alginate export family protein n=1 Tax=Sandaracinus amylolyticus TaxID=927083 RepID=UPI001F4444F6|nr:alginate export family protein [Sandaracinus amylolyticus]UJR84135.1 Hypothetical protein I5071_62060 [Sandaracinus amylolyticus]
MTTLRHAALAAMALALASLPPSARAQDQDTTTETEPPAPVIAAPPPGVIQVGELELRPQLESRARAELRIDPLIGRDDLYFVTMRNRLGMDARFRDVRVLLQFQDARDFGVVEPTASTGATTEVHQGFLQIGGEQTFVRVGRQEIDWGSQRFVGSLNWTSAARSFDAVRGRWSEGIVTLDAFGAWVRTVRAIFDARTGESAQSEGDWLAGTSASFVLAPVGRLGVYALYRHDGPTEVPSTITDPMQMGAYLDRQRDIVSPGVRLESEGRGPLRCELELVAQVGRVMDRDHVALAAVGEVHYRFDDVALAPSIGGGASYGSGAGADLAELDNFHPTNHARYGSADLIGLRNQAHGFVRAGIAPRGTSLEVWADVHLLALAEPGARWSDATGRTIAQDASNDERFLGTELDVEVRWRPDPHVALWGGYALFAPGAGAARLGREQVTHWAYLMLGVTLP